MTISLSIPLAAYKITAPLESPFIRTPNFIHLRGARLLRFNSRRKSPIIVRAKGSSPVPASDRLLAAVGYFLPFFDGVQYGRFFLTQFPVAQTFLEPLFPAIKVYNSYPYASILVFFTLYFAVVRNPNISRYVRFNTMQAIVLDILLIFPEIVERSFAPSEGLGVNLLSSFDSTVFLFLLTCLVYGSTSCLLGQVPRLPLVADAADAQVFWIMWVQKFRVSYFVFYFFEFCPNGKYVLYLMKMYNSGVVGVDPMGPTSVLNGNWFLGSLKIHFFRHRYFFLEMGLLNMGVFPYKLNYFWYSVMVSILILFFC